MFRARWKTDPILREKIRTRNAINMQRLGGPKFHAELGRVLYPLWILLLKTDPGTAAVRMGMKGHGVLDATGAFGGRSSRHAGSVCLPGAGLWRL